MLDRHRVALHSIACLAEGGYTPKHTASHSTPATTAHSVRKPRWRQRCTQAPVAPPTPPPTPPPPPHVTKATCKPVYAYIPLPCAPTSQTSSELTFDSLLQEPCIGYWIKGRCTMSGGARATGGDAKGADNTPPADAAVALMFLTVRLPWPVFPARRSLWRVLLHKSTGSGPEPIAGARAPAGGWRNARAHTLRCVPIVFAETVVRSRPVLRLHHNKLATGRGRGLCKL